LNRAAPLVTVLQVLGDTFQNKIEILEHNVMEDDMASGDKVTELLNAFRGGALRSGSFVRVTTVGLLK